MTDIYSKIVLRYFFTSDKSSKFPGASFYPDRMKNITFLAFILSFLSRKTSFRWSLLMRSSRLNAFDKSTVAQMMRIIFVTLLDPGEETFVIKL